MPALLHIIWAVGTYLHSQGNPAEIKVVLAYQSTLQQLILSEVECYLQHCSKVAERAARSPSMRIPREVMPAAL